MDKIHEDCLKACGDCAKECNMMAHHCLEKMLEGGSWAAGREIAAERRQGGGAPLAIASDGTLF